MTDTPKKTRRSSGDKAKKIVSLTIDPALINQVDAYAADRGVSRSAAIESAIMELLTSNSHTPFAIAENSLVQPDDSLFASPQLGAAIFY
jgi:hypothetical protein